MVMVLAGTIESWRGPDASSHVETRGTQLHHAHNEATCPACIVQSLHAQPERPTSLLPFRALAVVSPVALLRSASSRTVVTNAPRAPPAIA